MGTLGVGAALPLASLTARAMRALLFGVEPGDPAVYAGCAAVALAVTVLASAPPVAPRGTHRSCDGDQGRLTGVAPHSPKPSSSRRFMTASTAAADGVGSGGRAGPSETPSRVRIAFAVPM
jgi:hypothetical protein